MANPIKICMNFQKMFKCFVYSKGDIARIINNVLKSAKLQSAKM